MKKKNSIFDCEEQSTLFFYKKDMNEAYIFESVLLFTDQNEIEIREVMHGIINGDFLEGTACKMTMSESARLQNRLIKKYGFKRISEDYFKELGVLKFKNNGITTYTRAATEAIYRLSK